MALGDASDVVGWGIGMMAMMFLFWVLFIVGLSWEFAGLSAKARAEAGFGVEILRQRYARGEIKTDGSRGQEEGSWRMKEWRTV